MQSGDEAERHPVRDFLLSEESRPCARRHRSACAPCVPAVRSRRGRLIAQNTQRLTNLLEDLVIERQSDVTTRHLHVNCAGVDAVWPGHHAVGLCVHGNSSH